jgi:DNA-binding CsgD family transcriptional regulator
MVAILKHRNVASVREKNASRLRALLQMIFQAMAPSDDQVLMRHSCDRLEHILLDADFDGDRYVLIRIPLAQHPRLSLSPRQWEIVRLVAQGHSNKRIAALLNLSLWTVGTHVRRIFAKLGVNSRAAMVARLLEAGEGGDLGLSPRPATRREAGHVHGRSHSATNAA